jgi:tellurite resistance protein TehA-like permease
MATGILGAGAQAEGVALVPSVLAGVAAASWVALTVWTLRARARPTGLSDHLRRFGFVAACGVLISEPMVTLPSAPRDALSALAAAVWIALVAAAVPLLAASAPRGLFAGARGSWLLPVVATESLAVVSVLFGTAGASVGVALLWGGVAAYLALACLLAGRVLIGHVTLAAMTPDWWIVPGGLAISTLAATRLDAALAGHGVEPSLYGMLLALWVAATAMIPPILVVDALRTCRLGPRYEPERWACVFPLGMYAVATHAVGLRVDDATLLDVARVFFCAAAAVWTATLVGAVSSGIRRRSPDSVGLYAE